MTQELVALDAAGQTDIGLKRQRNEDSYHFQVPLSGSPHSQHGALFVVADGMGGMGGGDVASQTAINELFRHYYAVDAATTDPLTALKEALEAANVAVRDQAQQMNRVRIGATAAGVVLLPSYETLLFNVGDSRVYRIRQNYIELLTHDQSVLQVQIDGGLISEAEARQARNVNVTAFIGQPTPLQPVLRQAPAQLGDIFVICSDGLWDLVEPHEILNTVQQISAEDAARKFVALVRQRGAPDNVTVIVVRLGPKPSRRRLGWWVGILTALLLLVAAGVAYGFARDETPGTETPTVSSAAVAVMPTSVETVAPTLNPATPTHTTAAGLIILPTNTPSASPTRPTSSPTPTTTRTLTITVTASATPTRTLRPSDTGVPATHTAVPTASPTRTKTASPTDIPLSPTATLTPTERPKPTTTPRPPTVTLNPGVISPTPSLTPSPTSTLSPAQQMLVWADQEGARLGEQATLYLFGESDPTQVQEVLLPAGSNVRLLSEEKRVEAAVPGAVLREVVVLSEREPDARGWISQADLEGAEPAAPSVTTRTEQPVNLRYGDGTVFRVVGEIRAGEYAVILGMSSRDRTWYQVRRVDGTTGWVSSGVVQTSGDLSGLIVITPPPLPVVPSAPPADTPTDEPPLIPTT